MSGDLAIAPPLQDEVDGTYGTNISAELPSDTGVGHEMLINMLVETMKEKSVNPLKKEVSFNTAMSPTDALPPKQRRSTYADLTARKQSVVQLSDADRRPSMASRQRSGFASSPVRETLDASPSTPKPTAPITNETFKDPDYAAYLNRLASLSLDALRREPVLLSEESRQANSQLSALAFSEYRSFLTANASTHETRISLNSLDERLDALDAAIPPLNVALASFGEVSAGALRDRKRISTILASQQTWLRLLELLEIPQLHETFIRSGCYGEAMELQSHVNRLAVRHPNFALVQSVAKEVMDSAQAMLSQLIALLRGNVKLPLCLTVIGYLKKMNVYSDAELRIVFLQQRDAFFQDLINDIKETDSADYLKKYVELSRVHFTDIVVQYRNIFADSVPFSSSDDSLPPDPFHLPTPYATQSILSSYVSEMIRRFLDVLDHHLPNIHSASTVNSLMTETMYYGMSLGRVGVDFRPILAPPFEYAVERIVRGKIDDGVEAFGEWAANCGGELRGLYVRIADGMMRGGGEFGKGLGGMTSLSTSVVAPPGEAMSYPPFARLINAFFGAYNELRLVPVVSLLPSMMEHVEGSLVGVAMYLAEVGDVHGEEWESGVKAVFVGACEFFVRVVAPCLGSGLVEGVFGSVKEAVGKVDLGKVGEPLAKWVPRVVGGGGEGGGEQESVEIVQPPAVGAKENANGEGSLPPESENHVAAVENGTDVGATALEDRDTSNNITPSNG
ncbi:conserved oligomeric Golgi complex component [Rhizophlyctis rosea]|nr:conserved oligomeric Golgi complex component [Rhizophlyctis rosea]